MNIERIASILKPLIPDKINHWLKTRELADPVLKSLIDKQIISTAYQTFGDFHNKILLSLPTEKKATGTINLGTIIYDKGKWPLGISRSEFLQHVGIFGRSGSGKTNLAFHLITQMEDHNVPFLFFDNKRTLRHLLPRLRKKVNVYTPGRSLSKFSFNPFITPPGLEGSVYINQLVDVLGSAFTLGDGSKSIIRKAIFACYENGNQCPLIKDVIKEVEKIESKDRIRGWKISALRALESMNFSNITTNRISQEEMAQKLIKENTVIELDGLGDGARKFLIPILYQWLFQVKLSSTEREKLSMAVFIDEGHLVFGQQQNRTESLMERLLRQTRELGIATVIMDQTPSLISRVVLANCYTNIFLNLVSTNDLNKAAATSLLDADEKHYFSRLPVGTGIVKLQDRWTRPIHVKFPLVDIKKGLVTDEVLLRYFNEISSKLTDLPWKTSVLPEFDVFRQIYLDVILEKSALQLLFDILTHPQDGVLQRYRRLGLNEKTGHNIKEKLQYQGWIESQVVELGQTRKVLLRLSKQAKEKLEIDYETPKYGSLIHEYWKRVYGDKFKQKGYQVELEVPRRSGRVDVVARKENMRIAIEIETGKSNYLRNVQQDLAAKYNKVIVIATDKFTYEKIEKQLAQAGLLIAGRVGIYLRDEFIS